MPKHHIEYYSKFPWAILDLGVHRNALLALSPLTNGPKTALTVRLACLSHAASVQSEPGSNSSIDQSLNRQDKVPTDICDCESCLLATDHQKVTGRSNRSNDRSQQAANLLVERAPDIAGAIPDRRSRRLDGACGIHPSTVCSGHTNSRAHPRGVPNCSLANERTRGHDTCSGLVPRLARAGRLYSLPAGCQAERLPQVRDPRWPPPPAWCYDGRVHRSPPGRRR